MNMTNIYVCDDSPAERDMIVRAINETITELGLNMCVASETSEPSELLAALKDDRQLFESRHILFIDYDFGAGKDNGFSLAYKIRKLTVSSYIVLITKQAHQEMPTYKASFGANGYIWKDKKNDIKLQIGHKLMEFNGFIETYRQSKEYNTRSVAINGKNETVRLSDINFFQSNKNTTMVQLLDGEIIEAKYPMKAIEAKLDSRFVRSYRTHIANKDYIEAINTSDNALLMKNGLVIPVSIEKVKELLEGDYPCL